MILKEKNKQHFQPRCLRYFNSTSGVRNRPEVNQHTHTHTHTHIKHTLFL